MILVLDNYDSFTYNLVQYIGEFTEDIEVVRNDAVSLEALRDKSPEKVVISPGPGRPENAAYGGKVVQAPEILHGKVSAIEHNGGRLFDGIPSPLSATRYHSLVVEEASLPPELTVTARSETGLVMAIEHRSHPVLGVQFHPESILTEHGLQIIENYILRFP